MEDAVPAMLTLYVQLSNIAQSGTGVVLHHNTSQHNKQSFPMVEHVKP